MLEHWYMVLIVLVIRLLVQFFRIRQIDEVEFEPFFSDPIIDLLNQGSKDRQHSFICVVEWLFKQLECHSLLQEGGMRLAINIEGL